MNKKRRYEVMEAALAVIIHKEGHWSPNSWRLQGRLARFSQQPEFDKARVTLREVVEVYAHLSHHSMEVRKVFRFPHFFGKSEEE